MFQLPARRISLCLVPLVLALALASTPARAADAVPGLRGELIHSLDAAKSEILELAQAMPDDKYDWRPGKGVRSVVEVYLHVAQGNYSLTHMAGAEIPADIDLKKLVVGNPGKAKTIEILTRSFEHADQFIANLADSDLDRVVKVLGHDGTVRQALLIAVTHAHEHLGQSIAYARTNGVVPPWTARAEADAAAKAKDAKPEIKP
jgi:uncharacterized damage-inducible protein DinB